MAYDKRVRWLGKPPKEGRAVERRYFCMHTLGNVLVYSFYFTIYRTQGTRIPYLIFAVLRTQSS
jgi:hypothetical protein